MLRMKTIIDLYRNKGLHFEQLQGDKASVRSIRLNKKYRLEFKILDKEVKIINVIAISVHYKK
jgi:proteic killer suppression protein